MIIKFNGYAIRSEAIDYISKEYNPIDEKAPWMVVFCLRGNNTQFRISSITEQDRDILYDTMLKAMEGK